MLNDHLLRQLYRPDQSIRKRIRFPLYLLKGIGLPLLLFALGAVGANADTFTVTTIESEGAGSLRQAILDANARIGADRIEFHIEGTAPFLIAPEETLPVITDEVVVDATTQAGYLDRPLVTLDSSFLNSADASGLEIRAVHCSVKGIAVTGFGGAGILFSGTTDGTVDRCFLGLNAGGSSAFGNSYGVALVNSLRCQITNSVLSGNICGAYLTGISTDNVVRGCFVGTDIAGWLSAPNNYGVVLSGTGVQNNLLEQNLLSGNAITGASLIFGASNNVIQFNQVGANTYTELLPNGLNGIEVFAGTQNRIENNLVIGSPSAGVLLSGEATTDNRLVGDFIYGSLYGVSVEAGANTNKIGVVGSPINTLTGNLLAGLQIQGANSSGNSVLNNEISGNNGFGALIASSLNNLTGNKIFSNTLQGVLVRSKLEGGYPTGVQLKDNLIHDNGDLGIMLQGYGTLGANLMQPAPEIASADSNATSSFVVVRLKAAPSRVYSLQFFSTSQPDPSGYGGSEALIGNGTLTTDASGNGSVSLGLPSIDVGDFVTATATDPDGNTSEFSLAVPVGTAQPAPVIQSITPSSVLAGSAAVLITVQGSNFIPTSVIKWNDADRPTTFISATELRFTAPASDLTTPGSFRIAVATPAPGGGISNESVFTVNYPVPVLTSLSPSFAVKGSPSFTLTVTGSGFYAASKVRWNGVDRVTTFVSATSLSISVPAADLVSAGTVQITVSNPTPGGGVSTASPFTITNPAPALTRIAPNSATAGTSSLAFSLIGTNFVSGAQVLWNGSPRTTFYVSPTLVRAKLTQSDLAFAGTNNVSISNPAPGGGASNTLPFIVNGFPQVALFSATATRLGNNTVQVTITLRNFGTGPALSLNVVGSKLNGATTSSTLPISVPTLEAGTNSSAIVLIYPATVPAGSRVITVTMTSLGKSLTASRLVTVP